MYDVIVVGGGASGMMAAGRAAERGKRVLLLERNKRLGEKLRISGGGRCNITNAEPDENKLLSYYGDAEPFLHSAFSQFGMQETFDFFTARGLPLKVEARHRAFPESENALDVVRVLEDYMKKGSVEIRTGIRISAVDVEEGEIARIHAGKESFTALTYIFSTGGMSHPETGSTGDGFAWLTALGHTVKEPTPTIVPLKVRETWVRDVSGKSAPDVKLTFLIDGEKKFSRKGPILFTHFGISGPTVLNAAGKVADLIQEGNVTVTIDLFPNQDLGTLDRALTALFDTNKNKMLRNVLRPFLPPGLTDTLLAMLPLINPDTKTHSVRKEDRAQIIRLVKAVPLTIEGLMGFDRAVVADGGVPPVEIDMRTMRSHKVSNLLVTGDLLHITRPSGGYSLQLAWTTGFVAGSVA